MMSRILCFLSFILLVGGVQAFDQASVAQKKQNAVKRLEARKKGFDQFLAKKEKAKKARLARAFEMKGIRKKLADKKEKARRNFRRKTYDFPMADYRQFIKKRNKKRQSLESARQKYGVLRKQLQKVYQNKKYNIDGNKEFELD